MTDFNTSETAVPHRAITLDMRSGKPQFAIEDGAAVQERGQISIAAAKQQHDVAAAISATVALYVGQLARKHGANRINIRMTEAAKTISAALTRAGFDVKEIW